MNLLPLEIIHHILEYDGRIKYRNGKYMNQIAQDDDRYHLLRKIPVFHWDKWYSGNNYYVYRINYNDNASRNGSNAEVSASYSEGRRRSPEEYENHKMLVYIFDGSITYVYMNHKNHGCDFYKTIR